jgi:hypothetical protein
MRFKLFVVLAILTMLGACGKSNQTATSQPATIILKDGTTVSGSITKSDTSSVTMQTPNGVVTTYPMTQVSSINYGSASPANQQPSNPASPGSAQNTPPAQATPTPAPESAPPAVQAPPPVAQNAPLPEKHDYQPSPTYRTVPAGTTLEVRNDQTIDAQTAEPGQAFSGTVVNTIVDTDGKVAIPAGSRATLVVRNASEQGKLEGRSGLEVDVASVEIGGRRYRMETSNYVEQGKQGLGKNKRTAIFTGGGTALGTILGAVAGGGKGAAIGALSGAAAGVATQGITRGKAARVPAETVMRFRLEAPIRVREMR